MSEWDRHTDVAEVAEGRYAAELSEGWVIGGGVNGGYLLALLGTALSRTVPGKPDPLTLSAYYLSASTPGPAEIATRVVRDGGRTTVLAADLVQGDQPRITALATFGRIGELGDDVHVTAAEPDLPPREQCVPGTLAPEDFQKISPMLQRFDMLFDPECVGWALGKPSGRGMFQAWFRLKDGREPDALTLLAACDLLPPVTFDLGMPGWAPTVEFTVHVRAHPAPGWLKLKHFTTSLEGGSFVEDCEVWDSAGHLVAQSRQLARQPRG